MTSRSFSACIGIVFAGLVAIVSASAPGSARADMQNCAFDRDTCRYSWDFETGRMPPNQGFDNEFLRRDQLRIMAGGAFDGERFGQVIVNDGEFRMTGRNGETTERAEISTDRMRNVSGIMHFGVAVRFGPEFNAHDDRTLILQIKPNYTRGFNNSPQFAIYHNASFDRWKVCNDIDDLDNCDYQSGRIFRPNTWHRIVVSQNLSRGADGWLRFYVDGRLVYSHNGPTQYARPEAFTQFRVGIYRNATPFPQVLDVDNFILSRDLNAVAQALQLDPNMLQQ